MYRGREFGKIEQVIYKPVTVDELMGKRAAIWDHDRTRELAAFVIWEEVGVPGQVDERVLMMSGSLGLLGEAWLVMPNEGRRVREENRTALFRSRWEVTMSGLLESHSHSVTMTADLTASDLRSGGNE